MIQIKKGLNLPLIGEPEQKIYEVQHLRSVALLASDYHGILADVHVSIGQNVKCGQPLF